MMRKKIKPRNPYALALRSALFSKKVVANKKAYTRKKNKSKSLVD